MKLKAYKTVNPRRALRVTLVSDYLDPRSLEAYRKSLDCLAISSDMYISIFSSSHYPVVNIDEYFNYIELLGIDIGVPTKARDETLPVLVEILETKYGIEYADFES